MCITSPNELVSPVLLVFATLQHCEVYYWKHRKDHSTLYSLNSSFHHKKSVFFGKKNVDIDRKKIFIIVFPEPEQ